ncbi:MAG: hypothetical protein LPH21_18470, partial [Shewanella sp.]|nr:hypothetical protein [Shewanella sp.]
DMQTSILDQDLAMLVMAVLTGIALILLIAYGYASLPQVAALLRDDPEVAPDHDSIRRRVVYQSGSESRTGRSLAYYVLLGDSWFSCNRYGQFNPQQPLSTSAMRVSGILLVETDIVLSVQDFTPAVEDRDVYWIYTNGAWRKHIYHGKLNLFFRKAPDTRLHAIDPYFTRIGISLHTIACNAIPIKYHSAGGREIIKDPDVIYYVRHTGLAKKYRYSPGTGLFHQCDLAGHRNKDHTRPPVDADTLYEAEAIMATRKRDGEVRDAA